MFLLFYLFGYLVFSLCRIIVSFDNINTSWSTKLKFWTGAVWRDVVRFPAFRFLSLILSSCHLATALLVFSFVTILMLVVVHTLRWLPIFLYWSMHLLWWLCWQQFFMHSKLGYVLWWCENNAQYLRQNFLYNKNMKLEFFLLASKAFYF